MSWEPKKEKDSTEKRDSWTPKRLPPALSGRRTHSRELYCGKMWVLLIENCFLGRSHQNNPWNSEPRRDIVSLEMLFQIWHNVYKGLSSWVVIEKYVWKGHPMRQDHNDRGGGRQYSSGGGFSKQVSTVSPPDLNKQCKPQISLPEPMLWGE